MTAMYSFIAEEKANPGSVWSTAEMCRVLAVSRQGFYDWEARPPSQRQVTDRLLAVDAMNDPRNLETAIKAARKWAYTVKGVADEKAEIIACSGNFHGRTTTIIAMSDEPQYKAGFGPFALTRLCYETGGIYFAVHPNRTLHGPVSKQETIIPTNQSVQSIVFPGSRPPGLL